MEYREMLGAKPSLLGMGGMRFPLTDDGKIDEEASIKIIDAAMECGINYFDTAYVYNRGQSEKFLGRALVARYPRDSFYIATKMPTFICKSADDFERNFEKQKSRLGVDYFDFYLMHDIRANRAKEGTADDSWERMEQLGVHDFIDRHLADGSIRRIGFSCHELPETVAKFAVCRKWDFVQLQINYLDWTAQRASEAYEQMTRLSLPIVVMEPVRGGKLADTENPAMAPVAALPDFAASYALRFCAEKPNIKVILSGMNSVEMTQENARVLSPSVPLTETEKAAMTEAVALMNAQQLIPCTTCGYCLPYCPAGIHIPRTLRRYNSYLLFQEDAELADRLFQDAGGGGMIDDCIACGACARECPQHIDIPKKLAELKAIRDKISAK